MASHSTREGKAILARSPHPCARGSPDRRAEANGPERAHDAGESKGQTPAPAGPCFVYILCADGTYYVGCTSDLVERSASTTKDTVRNTRTRPVRRVFRAANLVRCSEARIPTQALDASQEGRPHRGEPNRASRTREAPEPLTCTISCRASEGGPEAPDAGPSPQRVRASEPVLEPASRPGVTAFLQRTTGLPSATCGRSRRGTCSAGRADPAVLPMLP